MKLRLNDTISVAVRPNLPCRWVLGLKDVLLFRAYCFANANDVSKPPVGVRLNMDGSPRRWCATEAYRAERGVPTSDLTDRGIERDAYQRRATPNQPTQPSDLENIEGN